MNQTRPSSLPCEIICEVMIFALNPYSLINSICRMRHVNRAWFAATESRVFWQMVVEACRRSARPSSRPSKRDQQDEDHESIMMMIAEQYGDDKLDQELDHEEQEMNPINDNDDDDDHDDDIREEEPLDAMSASSETLSSCSTTKSGSSNNNNTLDNNSNSCPTTQYHYFKTHEFIDQLLHQTHCNRFYFFEHDDAIRHDGFLGFRRFEENSYRDPIDKFRVDDNGDSFLPTSSTDQDDQETSECSLFHEKVASWIEAFGNLKGEHLLLRALLEISLGHETTEFVGMKSMGTCVQAFFQKLFEPAMLLVREWQHSPQNKPKELHAFTKSSDEEKKNLEMNMCQDLFFNKNLLQFLKETRKEKSLFKQDIGVTWNDYDFFYHVIPRQYILFVIEHFTNMNIVNEEGDKQDVVTFIMDNLFQCGLHVENILFHDLSLNLRNFERTDMLKRILPTMSSGFYLQHLAVWTQNLSLLNWCLTVNDKDGDTKVLDHLTPKASFSVVPKSLTFQSYMRTYLYDSCGLNILHYAVGMKSVEFVRVLLNEYLCNPFVPARFSETPISLAYKNLMQHVGKSKNNVEQAILELFTQHYHLPSTFLEITEPIESTWRPNDEEKLAAQRQEGHIWFDFRNSEWQEQEDDLELNTNKVVERNGNIITYDTCTDDEEDYYYESDEYEYEECISLEWMKKQIKNLSSQIFTDEKSSSNNESAQCVHSEKEIHTDKTDTSQGEHNENESNSLKRKRYDPVYQEFGQMEAFTGQLQEYLSNFELLEVDDDMHWFCPTKFVKILERTYDRNKKQKLDENVDEIFINRGNCDIPKRAFNRVINEIGHDYKNEVLFMPHAKMMIQQHTETLMKRVFELASQIALFMGYDFITREFMLVAQSIISQTSPVLNFDVESHLKEICESDLDKDLMKIIERYIDIHLLLEVSAATDTTSDEDDDYEDVNSTCSDDSCTSITAICISHDKTYVMDEFDTYLVYTDNPTKKKQHANFTKHFTGLDGFNRSLQVEVHINSSNFYIFSNERDLVIQWIDGHLDSFDEMQKSLQNKQHD
ncbi:hypothetical protein FDP41_012724 [Naegleria fowleri]|uniref:F-box domain-containing protein n=1 Tax=Naegleria fowleri TaxID=5763 RepID=A0A6A5BZV2_NAEFO|nr:uncharacterized protein FDP41_012724 [Naegleria fowleri]KAF0980936.1 hypothetical protein FDP41_012724 [Naegleria fowleri]